MYALLKKELSSFFGSITGYVVIVVFLVINGLFIWVFPGDFNVLENGYATLQTLFFISPWVFLFLVPAVTMRLFSEEKKTGTIELLLTRPLTDLQIILAKYVAGLLLVLLSILPTLLYFFSVYRLGDPPGNIDTGGTWGSYLGLFFLAAIYVAIGLLASALSDNQIVAFLLAVFFSFFFFMGFEYLAALSFLQHLDSYVLMFGINEHYKALSRGVVDSRDLLYFLSVIAFFLMLTRIRLESRKW